MAEVPPRGRMVRLKLARSYIELMPEGFTCPDEVLKYIPMVDRTHSVRNACARYWLLSTVPLAESYIRELEFPITTEAFWVGLWEAEEEAKQHTAEVREFPQNT